jgi:hypothetical protein
MNDEARRDFWVHYRAAQDYLGELRTILTLAEGEFEALARVMKDDPTLVENGYRRLASRIYDLAQYAIEIEDGIDRKRVDGDEADKRIDAMIAGTVN